MKIEFPAESSDEVSREKQGQDEVDIEICDVKRLLYADNFR